MRHRASVAAVLGVAGALTIGAAALGLTAAHASPGSATSFSRQVLAEAVVPPGGRPTQQVDTLEPGWMRGAAAQPGVQGLVTVQRLFLYDEPVHALIGFVSRHLPTGARVQGTGEETGMAETLTVQLPVTGPHQYLATLNYVAGPTRTSDAPSELSVVAETVWVPPRPSAERFAAGGVVTVTGYRDVSPANGSTGPVSAVASATAARRIVRELNALARGPRTFCMESDSMFVVTVRPRRGAPPTFVARTAGCAGTVTVTLDGRPFPPVVERGCSLLRAVAAVLPGRATATLGAARTCRPTRLRAP